MHATMSIVGTVIGPLVSASYSLRILHHMGPTFTSITPAVSISLARFHASYSNCLASFLITLLLQHDSVTDSQVSDHVTDHSTARPNHHW